MEEDWKPFEVRETGERKTLYLQGTEESLVKIEADKSGKILEAIKRGWNVDIGYADIESGLNISKIADKLERTEGGKLVIKGNIGMSWCNITGDASFMSAQFRGDASFECAQFIGSVNFGSAHFSGGALFPSAQFSEDAIFESAQFNGYTNFASAHFSGDTSFRSAHFSGDAIFGSAHFSRNALFLAAHFKENAIFEYARFSEYANFIAAHFSEDANFGFTHFSGNTVFWGADFKGKVDFVEAKMKWPASFYRVKFQENKVWAGLKNEILFRIVRRVTRGRKELEKVTVTEFSRFNTTTIMDGSSNPRLKHYIDDEQWIDSWRNSGKLQRGLFYVWEAMCHCGRSIGLWAGWSAFFALAFAFIYWLFGCDSIAFDVGRLGGQQPNFLSYFYYSVVTFTTLVLGDIVPLTNWARLAVGAEVVCGYVMLGGLISIFANKLARRS